MPAASYGSSSYTGMVEMVASTILKTFFPIQSEWEWSPRWYRSSDLEIFWYILTFHIYLPIDVFLLGTAEDCIPWLEWFLELGDDSNYYQLALGLVIGSRVKGVASQGDFLVAWRGFSYSLAYVFKLCMPPMLIKGTVVQKMWEKHPKMNPKKSLQDKF